MGNAPVICGPWRRAGIVAASVSTVAAAHFLTPPGLHGLHWIHILLQKLFYLPILMAAAWFRVRGTVLAASAVSALFGAHVLLDWSGFRMTQAEQIGEIVSFWIIAATASFLFRRERKALEEAAEAHRETIGALASSLDLRERETGMHSKRVQEYALLLARRLGIKDGEPWESLEMGALLHDVGKIGVPDGILLKKGGLTDEERDVVRRHPELGASLLRRIPFLSGAREIVQAHHEKYDGSGYPRGLRGDAIPIGARIFAVADVFDALTTDRPYRPADGYRKAIGWIVDQRGASFDPGVVDAFLRIPYGELRELAARFGVTLAE
ncbi:MAG: HD domain-containing protein [Deltaproteobacteria bacterium]|nr:HD domain-containing protein [Deltaproteobacteria bacterium]